MTQVKHNHPPIHIIILHGLRKHFFMFSPWDDLREAMRKKVIFYDPGFCTFIVVEIVKMVYPIPRELLEEFLKYYLASAITIFYKHTIAAQTILL